MKQWFVEFKHSWGDRTFICSIIIFVLSYLLLIGLGLLINREIYTLIISAIAGWQIADWSYYLAPKLKQLMFKD
jgi:hypothetical protein